jgi:hypothetical protein
MTPRQTFSLSLRLLGGFRSLPAVSFGRFARGGLLRGPSVACMACALEKYDSGLVLEAWYTLRTQPCVAAPRRLERSVCAEGHGHQLGDGKLLFALPISMMVMVMVMVMMMMMMACGLDHSALLLSFTLIHLRGLQFHVHTCYCRMSGWKPAQPHRA